MRDWLEAAGLFILLGIMGIGAFALILIVQPWFWLAMIALILAVSL